MKYKDIIGYNKPKKKLIKEEVKSTKPKVNTVIENIIKSELNEWNDSSFKTLPKRWSKSIKSYEKSGLSEFEEQGGRDTLKEVGAAPLYRKHIKLIDKNRDQVGKETLKFYDLLRKKGLDKAAEALLDSYKKNVINFGKDLKQIIRKLM